MVIIGSRWLELGEAGGDTAATTTTTTTSRQFGQEMSGGRVGVELAVGLRDEEVTRSLPDPEVQQCLGQLLNPLLPLLLRLEGHVELGVGVLHEEGVGATHQESLSWLHHHTLYRQERDSIKNIWGGGHVGED